MLVMRRLAPMLLLAVAACTGAGDAAPPDLAGTAWQATRLSDGTAVADPGRLTIAFGTEGRAAIRADCNRGSGAWRSTAPGEVAFGPIATTRVACAPGSQGDRFTADLGTARRYTMRDGLLVLEPGAGGGPLVLRPQPR